MNRLLLGLPYLIDSVPHERGDEPQLEFELDEAKDRSPRAWG